MSIFDTIHLARDETTTCIVVDNFSHYFASQQQVSTCKRVTHCGGEDDHLIGEVGRGCVITLLGRWGGDDNLNW